MLGTVVERGATNITEKRGDRARVRRGGRGQDSVEGGGGLGIEDPLDGNYNVAQKVTETMVVRMECEFVRAWLHLAVFKK